jgi:hypothetical protein
MALAGANMFLAITHAIAFFTEPTEYGLAVTVVTLLSAIYLVGVRS